MEEVEGTSEIALVVVLSRMVEGRWMMRVPVGLDLGLPDLSFVIFPVRHLDCYTQPLTFSSFHFVLELRPGIFLAVYTSEFPRLRCLRYLLLARVVGCSALSSSVYSPVCFSMGVVSEGGSRMVATSSCVKLGVVLSLFRA